MVFKSLRACYDSLVPYRREYLERARDAAKLTIPALMPDEVSRLSRTELPTPFQGVGARGVTNLASKLSLSLLPPASPFFRLQVQGLTLSDEFGEEAAREVEKSLVAIERAVHGEVEQNALRVPLFEALKQLIVSGNVVLHVLESGKARAILLDQFVCERDPSGNLELLIVKESVDRSTLDPELRARLPANVPAHSFDPEGRAGQLEDRNPENLVDVYTGVLRIGTLKGGEGEYEVWQEVCDVQVEPEKLKRPERLLNYLPLRMTQVPGESYGRGRVEEFIGDLISLEGLTRSIVEGAAASARVLFLIDPSAGINPVTLNNTPNGGFAVGRAVDVQALQLQKFADFNFALVAAQRIEERLAAAFLLNTSVQRQAERVTAEEIRFVAAELEASLGGVFTVLTVELQLPLVRLILASMTARKLLPKLPPQVQPTIVTGVDALGRTAELSKMQMAAQVLQNTVGPEAFLQNVDPRAWIEQVFIQSGLDADELLFSPEEIAQAQQTQTAQLVTEKLGPELVRQLGPGIAQQYGLAPQGGDGSQPQ